MQDVSRHNRGGSSVSFRGEKSMFFVSPFSREKIQLPEPEFAENFLAAAFYSVQFHQIASFVPFVKLVKKRREENNSVLGTSPRVLGMDPECCSRLQSLGGNR